jgi:ethanolamine ammonia-lyase small subunit
VGDDPWIGLRRFTSARIALGRTGGSQRMQTVLDFRLSHARARDAVMAPFDPQVLSARLGEHGLASHLVSSAVTDKKTYLVRPDLGRRLSEASRKELAKLAPAWGPRDLAIIISDGLAAQAAVVQARETAAKASDAQLKALGARLDADAEAAAASLELALGSARAGLETTVAELTSEAVAKLVGIEITPADVSAAIAAR